MMTEYWPLFKQEVRKRSMSTLTYPSLFEQKVLSQEAPGAAPARISLVVPTVTSPDEKFDIRIALMDETGYPSCEYAEDIVVRMGEREIARVDFQHGEPAVAAINDVQISDEGFTRFEAYLGATVFHSNPVLCTKEDVKRVYWGDPHVHTILSQCHADKCRSLNFCYIAARHLSGLDWVGAADHVSNGRCDFSKWKEQCTACNLYDDPPKFATLPAYEASLRGGSGGDNNVYMKTQPEMFVDEHTEGNARTLCEKLAQLIPEDHFIVVPHHTTRTGKHGEIDSSIYPGPNKMPVVEIHSKWGTSEYRGNPNALQKIHPGPSYVVDLLNSGLPLGFIGGTDTHATIPSGGGFEPGHIDRLPGITAVRTTDLNRDSIFDAIRSRSCYATSLERIYLDVRICEAEQGSILESFQGDGRKIVVSAAAQSDITSIEIVRNGEALARCEPSGWFEEFVHEDAEDLTGLWLESEHLGKFIYYYLRVTCTSGAQAWSSPVWLKKN